MPHRPQKKWGQNFLRNRGAIERIVAALEPAPGELVLEIGPGEGVLTEDLVRLGNPVEAWEIDPALVRRLRERFEGITVVETDATKTPLPDQPFRAVGNLPYNVATAIVRRVVSSAWWRRGVFMFQKEVAEKLTASPGDGEYGFLSVAVQVRATARSLMKLSPGSFHPRPKVHSAVVVLDPIQRDLRSSVDEVERLASSAFRMRRKTLLNNLTGYAELDRGGASEAIVEAGLDPGMRAEEVGLDAFDRLAAIIAARAASAPANPPPRGERP